MYVQSWVGWVVERILWSGSKDLIHEKSEVKYVVIEIRLEG
jgi:hypothetical protein